MEKEYWLMALTIIVTIFFYIWLIVPYILGIPKKIGFIMGLILSIFLLLYFLALANTF